MPDSARLTLTANSNSKTTKRAGARPYRLVARGIVRRAGARYFHSRPDTPPDAWA
jgi:hypothetical protein